EEGLNGRTSACQFPSLVGCPVKSSLLSGLPLSARRPRAENTYWGVAGTRLRFPPLGLACSRTMRNPNMIAIQRPPLDIDPMSRILIVRLSAIGDVVHGLPVL